MVTYYFALIDQIMIENLISSQAIVVESFDIAINPSLDCKFNLTFSIFSYILLYPIFTIDNGDLDR